MKTTVEVTWLSVSKQAPHKWRPATIYNSSLHSYGFKVAQNALFTALGTFLSQQRNFDHSRFTVPEHLLFSHTPSFQP